MPHRRGQPVVVLLAVLCGWAGGRVSAWEADAVSPASATHLLPTRPALGDNGYSYDPLQGPQTPVGGFAEAMASFLARQDVQGQGMLLRRGMVGFPQPIFLDMRGASKGAVVVAAPIPADPGRAFSRGLMEGPMRDALPPGLPSLASFTALAGAEGTVSAAAGSMAPAAPVPRRWSIDTWALLRGNGPGPLANGALPASYGASQAGAILRYRLAPKSPYRPEIYMRSTATLQQVQRETAAAIGLAARPLPTVPVIAALEGRLTEQAGVRRFQPVAMAITALPPFEMPHRLQGEAYGQAGYVAGKFATPFAEGQFRVDHALLQLGRVESRLGGGIWGGAQKGANRLDAGPSAVIAMPLGRGVFGRVGVDWRFRLAGDAEPGSGPALTLSAGF